MTETQQSLVWAKILAGQALDVKRARQLFKYLPGAPRCKMCNAPLHGMGRAVMTFAGRSPDPNNPQFCTACQTLARLNPGGADALMTVFVADGRAWAAKGVNPAGIPMLLSRYHRAARRALVDANAFIDRTAEGTVIAAFIPGLAGPDHAPLAASASHQVLHETGHAASAGPWLPVGVGIHTGVAHVGIKAEAKSTDVTVSGDAVTLAASLAGAARPGEALVSETTVAAGIRAPERRSLDLKTGTAVVGVLKVVPGH
jgi:adenylate cyclase